MGDFERDQFDLPSGYLVADRYEVLEAIGAGGTARVFRVRDIALQDEGVALKLLAPGTAHFDEFEARLRREVLLARRLGHPNIVRVYDFGKEQNGCCFITMEFVEGKNLSEYLAAQPEGKLSLGRALNVLEPLVQALEFAHGCDVIHRDLKPENVFVTSGNVIKLGDFGSANMMTQPKNVTRRGMAMGTPGYMAPEQLSGRSWDARVDVYGLGMIAYELATGNRPPLGENDVATALLQTQSDFAGLSELPWQFQNFVETCTELDPDQRYQSMQQVREALSAIRGERGEAGGIFPATTGSAQPQRTTKILGRLSRFLR